MTAGGTLMMTPKMAMMASLVSDIDTCVVCSFKIENLRAAAWEIDTVGY